MNRSSRIGLFLQMVIPVIIVGVLIAAISSMLINNMMEQRFEQQRELRINSGITYIDEMFKNHYKLFFYLYGNAPEVFRSQEQAAKKEILERIEHIVLPNRDALLITAADGICLHHCNILKFEPIAEFDADSGSITLEETHYYYKAVNFKPWKWRIVYLLDLTHMEAVVVQNRLFVLIVTSLIVMTFIVTLSLLFFITLKRPLRAISEQLDRITGGDYTPVAVQMPTKEFATLAIHLNEVAEAIRSREEQAQALLEKSRESERYVYDILHSQRDIIIVNDTREIIDVNSSFFDFFSDYSDLAGFRGDHPCVCDYFEKKEGYIYAYDDQNWVNYVLKNPKMAHRVKIIKENRPFFFLIRAVMGKYADRIIVTMTDITELIKREEELRASNTLLTEYKKSVDASAIVSKSDINGIITYVNDLFCNISGYSKDELIGHSHSILRHSDVPDELFKQIWETISAKQIWHGVIKNRAKDGHEYYVASTISPILDHEDNIIEYLALRYDITEQIHAIEYAKASERSKSLFLANMSHELRTPLNAIIGFSQILLNKSDTPEHVHSYIEKIQISGNNLLEQVNSILDFSKIEAGKMDFNPQSFEVQTLFDEVRLLTESIAHKKGIKIDFLLTAQSHVFADIQLVKQVLINLITNAIKFSEQNTYIEVGYDNSGEQKFCVSDQGSGIAPEEIKTLFDRFTQASNAKQFAIQGTGLGLAISQKIVQMHKGKIWVESEVGKGSSFYFTLAPDNSPVV